MPEDHEIGNISENGNSANGPGDHAEEMIDKEFSTEVNPENILLREKTFTSELRRLVEKVTAHDALESIDDGDIDRLSEDELVRRFHALFYRVLHVHHLEDINEGYNPFLAASGLSGENLITSISEKMSGISYPAYALLPYQLEKRCFMPVVSTIADLEMVNLFIDVHDDIYKNIKASTEGIIITPEMIQKDFFLKKRFGSKASSDNDSYYINSIRNIYSGIVAEALPPADVKDIDIDFSPLIIISLKGSAELLRPPMITRTIALELSIQLLMYAHYQSEGIRPGVVRDLEHAYGILEYLYQLFMQSGKGRCFVLACGDEFSNERRFIISYFLSKLRREVSPKTMIAQLDNRKIMIFACERDFVLVEDMTAILNRLFAGIFTTRIYDNKDKLNFLDFMGDYIF